MASGGKKNERQPVTARGAELLALIAAAGEGGLMLTQAEGLDAVNAGHAQVDTSVVDGETAKVTLTEAGQAALNASDNSATTFEIEDNVPMPERTTRARTGGYPFEQLAVGQSFHVAPKGNEAVDKLAARISSSVSGARARFAEETGGTRTVTVRDYQKNADGSFAKGADGKRIVTATRQETRPETRLTRDFKVAIVGENDPKGAGVRVWRIEPTAAANAAQNA